MTSPRNPYDTVAAFAINNPIAGTSTPFLFDVSATSLAFTANPQITTPIALNCAVVNLRFKITRLNSAENGISSPLSV